MLFGVQDFVRDASLGEHLRELLGLFDRCSSYEDGLAFFVAFRNVGHRCVELAPLGAVDEVRVVNTHHWQVGGDGHHLDLVGRTELRGFCQRCACHPRQLFVEAEVVLQGHSCPGVVLFVDRHPFFCFNRLVEPV